MCSGDGVSKEASQIRRPSVEVEGQLLTTNGDRSQILRVVLSRVGGDSPIIASSSGSNILGNWLAIFGIGTSKSSRTRLDAWLGNRLLDDKVLVGFLTPVNDRRG